MIENHYVWSCSEFKAFVILTESLRYIAITSLRDDISKVVSGWIEKRFKVFLILIRFLKRFLNYTILRKYFSKNMIYLVRVCARRNISRPEKKNYIVLEYTSQTEAYMLKKRAMVQVN